MEKQIFSVYDTAADMFLEPFFCPSIDFALREFKRAVNDEGHQFNRYPEDYTLFHIGTFDAKKGDLIGFPPRSVAIGITLLKPDHVGLDMTGFERNEVSDA